MARRLYFFSSEFITYSLRSTVLHMFALFQIILPPLVVFRMTNYRLSRVCRRVFRRDFYKDFAKITQAPSSAPGPRAWKGGAAPFESPFHSLEEEERRKNASFFDFSISRNLNCIKYL